MDPLWCFTHANSLNSRQLPFDERQQKTDYLVARQNSYDALLLGSSRTTFISQEAVTGYRAFNAAVNAMMPDEYAPYAGFFKNHNSSPIKLIIIGVDFFGSNANFKGYGHSPPEVYFKNAENPLFPFKTLLTADAVRYSLQNIRQLFAPSSHKFYDRKNIKHTLPISTAFRQHYTQKDLIEFKRNLYGNTYQFHDIKKHLQRMKADNISCKFIVFTTPDSLPLWQQLIQAGRLEDYLHWLRDLVDVFGEVYDTMGINKLTSNLDNFQDAHHLTPAAANGLVQSLLQGNFAEMGYGTLLTRSNIDYYLALIRKNYSTHTKGH